MLYDSHNHLQDAKLCDIRADLQRWVDQEHVGQMVVNGTREEDWPAVRELARRYPVVLPSYGLHPWYVPDRGRSWQARLLEHLDSGRSAIGEIGLDRWIKGYNLPDQESVFSYQLALAAERDLPVAIHCLGAWGRLVELLQARPRPARGFLLHSYSGPLELVQPLVRLGAYFSISGYFAHPRKQRQSEVFRGVPIDRLLIETDAPDMQPPPVWIRWPVPDKPQANHPANIGGVYAFTAKLLGQPTDTLIQQVETNFFRLFGRT